MLKARSTSSTTMPSTGRKYLNISKQTCKELKINDTGKGLGKFLNY